MAYHWTNHGAAEEQDLLGMHPSDAAWAFLAFNGGATNAPSYYSPNRASLVDVGDTVVTPNPFVHNTNNHFDAWQHGQLPGDATILDQYHPQPVPGYVDHAAGNQRFNNLDSTSQARTSDFPWSRDLILENNAFWHPCATPDIDVGRYHQPNPIRNVAGPKVFPSQNTLYGGVGLNANTFDVAPTYDSPFPSTHSSYSPYLGYASSAAPAQFMPSMTAHSDYIAPQMMHSHAEGLSEDVCNTAMITASDSDALPLDVRQRGVSKELPSNKSRAKCIECNKDFARRSDLNRHERKHQSGARKYQCGVEGCAYAGSLRLDKMAQHLKNCHLGGKKHAGVIEIAEFCVPVSGECTLSGEFLHSEAFAKGRSRFRRGGYFYSRKLEHVLTEDGKGVKRMTAEDYKRFPCRY